MPTVGIMHSGSPEAGQREIDILITRLKEKFKKSLTIDGPHYANFNNNNLAKIAQQLIDKNVDIFIPGGGSRSALAAIATRGNAKTPIIVFTSVAPYVLNGIDLSITTGVDAHTSDHDGKRLEWLLKLLQYNDPAIGVLRNSNRGDAAQQLQMIGQAAQGKCNLVDADINSPLTIKGAFDFFKQNEVDALLVAADHVFFGNRWEVVDRANNANYPAIYQWREFVSIGGLMSYGPNLNSLYAEVGQMVAYILDSGKVPPVQDVPDSAFELVVSQAKATHFSRWPLPSAIASDPRLIVLP